MADSNGFVWLIQKAPVLHGVPWYQRVTHTMGGVLLDWTWDRRLALRFDSEKEAANWIDTFKPINNISATVVGVDVTPVINWQNVWVLESVKLEPDELPGYYVGFKMKPIQGVERAVAEWTPHPAYALQFDTKDEAEKHSAIIKEHRNFNTVVREITLGATGARNGNE